MSTFTMRHRKTILLGLILLLALLPAAAMAAGSGGSGVGESGFTQLYDAIKGLLSGALGKLLTILTLGVALVIAVKMQSIIGVLSAFAVAIAAVYGPTALEAFFVASLPLDTLTQATTDSVAPVWSTCMGVLPGWLDHAAYLACTSA